MCAQDVWFFEPGMPIRSLKTLIEVYHQTVGRNCVLEMDFAINRDVSNPWLELAFILGHPFLLGLLLGAAPFWAKSDLVILWAWQL